jgi:hypothetical protein
VGTAAGIPDLWGICGENGVLLRRSCRRCGAGLGWAAVGPGRPSATMVAVADVLALRQAFDDAELRGDADRLDALLSDDFLSIGEQG